MEDSKEMIEETLSMIVEHKLNNVGLEVDCTKTPQMASELKFSPIRQLFSAGPV